MLGESARRLDVEAKDQNLLACKPKVNGALHGSLDFGMSHSQFPGSLAGRNKQRDLLFIPPRRD